MVSVLFFAPMVYGVTLASLKFEMVDQPPLPHASPSLTAPSSAAFANNVDTR